MWERPFASMNILKCATFRLSPPPALSLSSYATWVSWSTLCARLSRTFIVAVEQRQPGSSSLSSSDLYPFVLSPTAPSPSLSLPPWHSYNCRIQCTHTHWMLYSFSLCFASLPACCCCCCFVCAHRRWLLSPVRVNTWNTCAGFQCICVNTLKLNYLFTNSVRVRVCVCVCVH